MKNIIPSAELIEQISHSVKILKRKNSLNTLISLISLDIFQESVEGNMFITYDFYGWEPHIVSKVLAFLEDKGYEVINHDKTSETQSYFEIRWSK